MAKELPYFRFTVQDWQNGKISIETYELKGIFIEICGYYWINDCSITLAMLQKKFRNDIVLIEELIFLCIIKHEKRHDKIEIEFLDNQYDLLSEKRKLRQSAGSKGGNAKAMLKQKDSYKDKDNDNDNDKLMLAASPSQTKKFTKPELLEIENYFLETFGNANEASKFQNYYDANGWKVGRNPMKDWKAASRNWIENSKNFNNSNQNGKQQLTKSELEQQKFNERYGTNFGSY